MSDWIATSEQLPEVETPVLICHGVDIRIGELRWETPGYEDNFTAYKYWDDPVDDGQCWEWHDITHWMPLPELPAAILIASEGER